LELIDTFKLKGISFEDKKAFIKLLDILNGHPANTMIVMQNLYFLMLDQESKTIKQDDLYQAYENGYYEMINLVEQYIVEIKDKKHYHEVLYKIANKQSSKLSPQALHQVKKGLLDMGYLQKIDKGEYRIIDNFLEVYLIDKDHKKLINESLNNV